MGLSNELSCELGVSPTDTSTPTGVFSQWFEALFPCTGTLGLCALSPGPSAAALPASCSFAQPAPQSATSWVRQPPPCHESSLPSCPSLPAPPTGLGECFFFISLVVGLSYSSIFCQFWLFFVFKFVVLLLVVLVGGGTMCLTTRSSWLEVLHPWYLYRNCPESVDCFG